MALDAVQRAHDAELKNINEKVRNVSSNSVTATQPNITAEARSDVQFTRQRLITFFISILLPNVPYCFSYCSKMLEQMSAELAQLSALYSAKCLENSQLDEKMSLLLADKENQSSLKYLKHSTLFSPSSLFAFFTYHF